MVLLPPLPAASADGARWIQQRYVFGQPGYRGEVGPDFEAYVRIFHPHGEGPDAETWAEVAASNGKVMHLAAHWDEITADGPWHPTRQYDWNSNDALYLQGNVPLPLLKTVCGVLRRHTATPNDCFFAVWDGWGWDTGVSLTFTSDNSTSPTATPEPDPTYEMDRNAPRFSVPARDFLLYHGRIEQAASIGGGNYYPESGFLWEQSPTLMWPADHAWCLSTEIDDEYTVIGCASAAAQALVDTAGIEAAPISSDTPHISQVNQ